MASQDEYLTGIHGEQALRLGGDSLEDARAALVLVHGRGASADDILMLGEELYAPGVALIAPQAAGGTWYPNRFLAPTHSNEPWLSSALASVGSAVARAEAAGIAPDRIILVGFSQGACLALEYAARNGRRYGAVAGLSGGLIGAEDEPRHDRGDLEGTPVLLGCSDIDPHIPLERVEWSAQRLQAQGAVVTTRIYPGMGHTINEDELDWLREQVQALVRA